MAARAKPMIVGTLRTDYSMAMGIQWTGIKPMTVGVWCLGDNPNTKTTYSYHQKMTKMQRMRIRSMATGIQQTNFSSRAEANSSNPQGLRKAL